MAMKDAADCRFIDADSLRYGTFRLSMPQETGKTNPRRRSSAHGCARRDDA
jgi:hypothetical protein